MNLLQNLDAPQPLLVTLNCTDQIDPNKILQKETIIIPFTQRLVWQRKSGVMKLME